VPVDTFAVVRVGYDDVVLLLRSCEPHGRRRRLAGEAALVGALDAVVDAVSQQVYQRITDLLDYRAVQFCLTARNDEINFLVLHLGQVSHQSREAAEDVADGHHPHLHDVVLQLVDDLDTWSEVWSRSLTRSSRCTSRTGAFPLCDAGAVDDQFLYDVHEVSSTCTSMRTLWNDCGSCLSVKPSRRGAPPAVALSSSVPEQAASSPKPSGSTWGCHYFRDLSY
jgi:hypothetical protein